MRKTPYVKGLLRLLADAGVMRKIAAEDRQIEKDWQSAACGRKKLMVRKLTREEREANNAGHENG